MQGINHYLLNIIREGLCHNNDLSPAIPNYSLPSVFSVISSKHGTENTFCTIVSSSVSIIIDSSVSQYNSILA